MFQFSISKQVFIAVASMLGICCGSLAPAAASCFSSAAEVRREDPKAWPRWTYDPHGKRCWYAGEKKSVFAKTPPEEQFANELDPPVAGEDPWSRGTVPMHLPWALEYRWAIGENIWAIGENITGP